MKSKIMAGFVLAMGSWLPAYAQGLPDCPGPLRQAVYQTAAAKILVQMLQANKKQIDSKKQHLKSLEDRRLALSDLYHLREAMLPRFFYKMLDAFDFQEERRRIISDIFGALLQSGTIR